MGAFGLAVKGSGVRIPSAPPRSESCRKPLSGNGYCAVLVVTVRYVPLRKNGLRVAHGGSLVQRQSMFARSTHNANRPFTWVLLSRGSEVCSAHCGMSRPWAVPIETYTFKIVEGIAPSISR